MDGDLVAFCPHWSTLLITGANDTAGLAGCLATATEQMLEAPKPLSCQPIVRRGTGWETLTFPRGHDLYELTTRARVIDMAGLYDEQQQVLQSWCTARGDDVYVAPFYGAQPEETGQVRSYGVWGRGVVTLLPETESAAFFDDDLPEDDKITPVDWDIMRTYCHDLLEPTDHDPPRWRVESFPSEETMGLMREAQARREG